MSDTATGLNFVEIAADIVSAYVSKNSIPASELPELLAKVHGSLTSIAGGQAKTEQAEPKTPAVPVKKSVTPDFVICLEDGKKFKSLKRHLRTTYNLSPAEYRAKWDLPHDYPMVAPNYAKARSELAKQMGLGQQAGRSRSKGTDKVGASKSEASARGRSKKAA